MGIELSSRKMVTVLFMEIVGYSRTSNEDQADHLTLLEDIVRRSPVFEQTQANNGLLPLPAGDGMAIVFLQADPVSAVKCALDVSDSLNSHPEIQVRMGINMGFVSPHVDIKKQMNVVGGGINLAQRIMDCGDAGHILVSQDVAHALGDIRGWRESLNDLGTKTNM